MAASPAASVGAFFAPIIAATIGWFDKHRSLAVSLVSIGGGVAPMVMTPLASVLIGAYGWRTAMLTIAIGVSLVVVAHRTPHPPRPRRRGGPPAGTAPARPGRRPRPGPRCARRSSSCWRRPSSSAAPPIPGPIFHTVSYAEICGATSLAAASIYSVEGVAGLFGRLIFGIARRPHRGQARHRRRPRCCRRWVFTATSTCQGSPDFYIRALVLGMAYGGVMPLYSILARDYFRQEVMGTVLGAITMTSSIGMAFGPVGGGWLFDTFGTYHWLYIASAAIGLAAAFMALAFPRPTRRQDEPTALQPA